MRDLTSDLVGIKNLFIPDYCLDDAFIIHFFHLQDK